MNFIYDMAKCPSSWDFLQWLVNVEIANTMQYGASPAEAKITIRSGPKDGFRDDSLARPLDQRQAILENVIRPAIQLIGGTEVQEEEGKTDVPYIPAFAVHHCTQNGGDIPYFRIPSAYADEIRDDYKGRRPIVITLREASYYPQRNSNLAAWIEFAKTCGEDVIFVRDTAKADEPIPGFETCPRASKDLLYRAALMRITKCNMMVANGPINLALYSPSPWLNFGALRPEIPEWKAGTPEFWARSVGVQVGYQFPWSHPNQRMIWDYDTLEVIRDAWAQYKDVMDNPPAYKLGELKTKGVWSDEERLKNCLANMAKVKARVPELQAHKGTAIIACYGPSLQDTYKEIRAQRNNIPGSVLVSVSGAHDYLMSKRLRPNIHIECDPRPHKALMLQKPHRKTKYLLASCVHPDVVNAVKGCEITLWHLFSGGGSWDLLKEEPDGILTAGGGSVGLRAICLMYQLGFRRFFIHGMDCSFKDDMQHASRHTGKVQHVRDIIVGERTFKTASIQVAYARQFFDMVDRMNSISSKPWDRIEIGLHGDGMLQEMGRQAMLTQNEERAA